MLNVSADVGKALARMSHLTSGMKGKIIAKSLNDTIKPALTQSIREIRAEGYNINVSKIKSRIKMYAASSGVLTAKLVAMDKPVNLVDFGAKQYGKSGLKRDSTGRLYLEKSRGGVKAKVKRRQTVIPGGFIVNGKAYIRESRTNQSSGFFGTQDVIFRSGFKLGGERIRQLLGPGVDQAFSNRVIQANMRKSALERFPKRIAYWASKAS